LIRNLKQSYIVSSELLMEEWWEELSTIGNRECIDKHLVGQDGDEVEKENETAYTISGLCLYLDASREWWYKFKQSAPEDFLHILSRIDNIIYTQKFEGAAVGAFNANLIARDLGLTEKTDNSHKIKLGKEFDFNYE